MKLTSIGRKVGVAALGGALTVIFVSSPAWADSASDSRATFVSGNATTCSDAGFASDTQLGSSSDTSASDANVSGTVNPNSGSVQPGMGEELDVAITGSNIVIDAVVVKGGNGYNVYSNSSYLPPTLGSPQHYISPLNGGGNVPTISHWFVCYHVSGSEVPVGAVGALGATGLSAAAFGVIMFRSRRRRAASTAGV